MPDFSARWTQPAGTEVFEDGDLGERLNPQPGHPHRHYLITTPTDLAAKATVGGVEGELDANLGGRLFNWHWAQWPGYPALDRSLPTIEVNALASSVISVRNHPHSDPTWKGLWVLCCRREGGGAVMLPLSFE